MAGVVVRGKWSEVSELGSEVGPTAGVGSLFGGKVWLFGFSV